MRAQLVLFAILMLRMWFRVRLFLYEMKKIFSWKLILLVLLVNLLMFKVLLEFDLEYFPNGRPAGDDFKIEQHIISKYGATMDEEEFLDLQATYEEEVAKADAFLANDPKAIAVEMDSYENFRDFDYGNEEKMAYHDEMFFNSEEDFPWVLQAYEGYLERYQHKEKALVANMKGATPAQKKRYEQLLEEEKFAVYTDTVTSNFKSYKTSMAIVIFLSVAILISPIFLRDVNAGVVPLQYSSKKGRSVYRTKWLAGLVSSILIASILLILYMTLYATNDTSSHFDLPLYTFGWDYFWYDITFLQYITLSIAVIFGMSVLLSILTMAISSLVPNTIVLIAVQIVIMFVMIAGGATVIINNLINIWYAQAFVPSVLTIFAVVTILVAGFVWRREGKRDIA